VRQLCSSSFHFPDPTTYFLAEEAQKSVKGMEENAIHAKYVELVSILLPEAVVSTNSSMLLVCRVQENGAGPCKGEAEIGKGQRRRFVFAVTSLCVTNRSHLMWDESEKSIDESKSDEDENGEFGSRAAEGSRFL
jgi:hypothetical protein